MRREKKIRKGLFKGRAGTVVMEAAQPKPLRLPPPPKDSAEAEAAPPSTMATIILRFDPSSPDAAPPRLGMLKSTLKVATFFASAPQYSFPSKQTVLYDINQGVYVDVVSLSSRNMQTASWAKHEPGTNLHEVMYRRDSGLDLNALTANTEATSTPAAHCPSPSRKHNERLPFYTAQLLVPIVLPMTCKAFVPTYHACLSSRIYILELALQVQGPSSVSSSMTLKIPLQISSATASTLPSPRGHEGIAQMVNPEDEYFRPRSMMTPMLPSFNQSQGLSDDEGTGNGVTADGRRATEGQIVDLPPEYSEETPRAAVGTVFGRRSMPASGLPGFHARR